MATEGIANFPVLEDNPLKSLVAIQYHSNQSQTGIAIALWINELGTPEIKKKFIVEANEAAAKQDHNRAAILCWAANLIVA